MNWALANDLGCIRHVQVVHLPGSCQGGFSLCFRPGPVRYAEVLDPVEEQISCPSPGCEADFLSEPEDIDTMRVSIETIIILGCFRGVSKTRSQLPVMIKCGFRVASSSKESRDE